MNFHVIIPARYQSTRLPGKPLALIGNIPMIVHVCQKSAQSGAVSVTVATDDQRIIDCVKSAGFNAVMTNKNHPSGSDRIFEAAQKINLKNSDIVVNVQGDEPFIPVENISQVAKLIEFENEAMATLACRIISEKQFFDPDTVKVVLDQSDNALYFSRASIPCPRDQQEQIILSQHLRHIGIYAYSMSFLEKYISWQEAEIEKIERLEQLRVLANGYKIKVAILKNAPESGVDNIKDLELANQYYSRKASE